MRVLVVDSDVPCTASIALMLKKECFVCDKTDLGEDGLEIAKLYDYDIIILDLVLPDIDGHEFLKRLRLAKIITPVLVLTGFHEIEFKLKAFANGADDYLTKPFDKRELLARVRSIVRRSKGYASSEARIGKLTLNFDEHVASANGKHVHLSNKEYSILELLVLRRGNVLTKEMFINHLYGGMDEPDMKIIDVFVCNLRQRLSWATGGDHYIETVWGRGYMIPNEAQEIAA